MGFSKRQLRDLVPRPNDDAKQRARAQEQASSIGDGPMGCWRLALGEMNEMQVARGAPMTADHDGRGRAWSVCDGVELSATARMIGPEPLAPQVWRPAPCCSPSPAAAAPSRICPAARSKRNSASSPVCQSSPAGPTDVLLRPSALARESPRRALPWQSSAGESFCFA